MELKILDNLENWLESHPKFVNSWMPEIFGFVIGFVGAIAALTFRLTIFEIAVIALLILILLKKS